LQQRNRILRGGVFDAPGDALALAELIPACREVQAAMQLQAA
jgi:hypothetical protein